MYQIIILQKQAILLSFFLFFSLKMMGQSPLLVKNETSKAFIKSAKLNTEIKLDDVDLELLKTTIFHLLNAKSKVEYKQSDNLDAIATNFIQNNRSTYFEPSYQRKKRLKKEAKRQCKRANYTATYLDISFNNLPLLNIRKSQKYRFDKENETFIFPKKKNSTKVTMIPNHTYLSLAKQILRGSSKTGGNSILTSKQYEEMGLAIKIDQKSMTRMPSLTVFWIVGGYRLKMVTASIPIEVR